MAPAALVLPVPLLVAESSPPQAEPTRHIAASHRIVVAIVIPANALRGVLVRASRAHRRVSNRHPDLN